MEFPLTECPLPEFPQLECPLPVCSLRNCHLPERLLTVCPRLDFPLMESHLLKDCSHFENVFEFIGFNTLFLKQSPCNILKLVFMLCKDFFCLIVTALYDFLNLSIYLSRHLFAVIACMGVALSMNTSSFSSPNTRLERLSLIPYW